MGVRYNCIILELTEVFLILFLLSLSAILSRVFWYIVSSFKKEPADESDKHVKGLLQRLIHKAFGRTNKVKK